MEELVLILGMIYTFAVGYIFACKADKFLSKHRRAFPGRRRIIFVDPPVWHDHSDEDPENCSKRYQRKENRENGKSHS